MPEISIVITTFNSEGSIQSCLDSVFSQDYRDFEVVVVDNGSRDGTFDYIKNDFPQITLIKNERNLGACRARNQGIEISRGNWVLTLDCDVSLEKNFLYEVIKILKEMPSEVGMLQPKILRPDKKTIYSCGVHLSWLRRFHDISKGREDNGRFDGTRYVFGACSACAFYSREMLEVIKEDTGYFDERFFFLVEDVDLAWRAQRRGWRGVFVPKAVCLHSGGSCGFDKKLRQYLCLRNRYYTIIKNEGLKSYSKKIIPLLFYDLPRSLYILLTNPHIFGGFKLNEGSGSFYHNSTPHPDERSEEGSHEILRSSFGRP